MGRYGERLNKLTIVTPCSGDSISRTGAASTLFSLEFPQLFIGLQVSYRRSEQHDDSPRQTQPARWVRLTLASSAFLRRQPSGGWAGHKSWLSGCIYPGGSQQVV